MDMMNFCAIQQKSGYVPYSDVGREYVVCPKPRRAVICNSVATLAGWCISHQTDIYDTDSGNELFNIFLSEDDARDIEHDFARMPSQPPFFCGSPPSRVSNPIIQDTRFVDEKQLISATSSTHLNHTAMPIFHSGFSTQTSSSNKVGFASASFGSSPAVRVEGFKALNNNRRSCSIASLA